MIEGINIRGGINTHHVLDLAKVAQVADEKLAVRVAVALMGDILRLGILAAGLPPVSGGNAHFLLLSLPIPTAFLSPPLVSHRQMSLTTACLQLPPSGCICYISLIHGHKVPFDNTVPMRGFFRNGRRGQMPFPSPRKY